MSPGTGIPVSIIDAEGIGLDMEATVQHIVRLRPRIVGITSTILSFPAAASAALALKKQLPKVVTVLGGPHVTALPGETLDNYDCIDAVIPGGGETGFTQLVRNILSGNALHHGVDMIENLVRQFNIHEVSIKDDTFTASADRVMEFAGLLAKKIGKGFWDFFSLR